MAFFFRNKFYYKNVNCSLLLANQLYGAASFRSRQSFSYSRICPHFIEPKSSLSCSQEPLRVPILCQMNPVHTTPSYFSKTHLILSFNLRLSLPTGLFAFGFPTKIVSIYIYIYIYIFRFSPMRATCPVHDILLDLVILIVSGGAVHVIKRFVLHFSPASYCFIPLRSKYSPQHRYQIPSVYVLPLTSETKFHAYETLATNSAHNSLMRCETRCLLPIGSVTRFEPLRQNSTSGTRYWTSSNHFPNSHLHLGDPKYIPTSILIYSLPPS
jgi:hypothetical protein